MAAECGSTPSFHLIDSSALLPLYSWDTVLGGPFSMCPQMARCAPGGQSRLVRVFMGRARGRRRGPLRR